jgi:hypothetical protein
MSSAAITGAAPAGWAGAWHCPSTIVAGITDAIRSRRV